MLRRHSYWLLPLITALAVAAVGARLITLSVRERSLQLRATAQTTVRQHSQTIEREFAGLVARARGEAARLAATEPSPAALPAPARGTFWMSGDGTVQGAPPADAALASALASGWASAPAAARGAATVLFGPVRYGSQWLVAARAPGPAAGAEAAAGSSELAAVSYDTLDAILARAHFGTLVNEGYDFQLSQPEPVTRQARVLLASEPTALEDPATAAIRTPAAAGAAATAPPPAPHPAAAPAVATPFLTLAVRPRTGWYPARELAAEIGLLALIAWALAFGAYDLTHSLKRTQTALAATRKRLQAANERLTHEIEQREYLQKSFEHARFHDAFTGLPNRRYFMDQLDRALREIRTRRRQRIVVVLIEIERLRLISDTLGHTAGDELLLQAAQRCAQSLGGAEHVLARWGADQLAVLVLEMESAAAAQLIADRLQQSRAEPFELRQHRLSVNARIGFTSIDSGLKRVEDGLREADLALSVAKEQQSARAVAYLPGMGGAAVSLVSLEADLHVALDRREFGLLFQPIVDLRGQRVVGAEALLRWRHPVEGLLTPDRFLALAEEAGVIVPVTRWIIQRVCRLAAEWRQRLPQKDDFYISVNLSAAVLRAPGLREYVARVLEETRTPPANLKFELSEGGLISNAATARGVLDAFHDMGIELMLDDFGTGYSSLSYLQLFPFDYVKIDRPFVSRTGSERANNAITAAILQMASNLGLRAVAEVVETKAAAQTLLEMGCDFAQGYYFSPPVEAEEAFRQLRSAGVFAGAGASSLESPQGDFGETRDASPTVMLPAGVILESRIKDDSDESQEESSTT
jgi:diguanylate cyclase (GGDEF)-like protein